MRIDEDKSRGSPTSEDDEQLDENKSATTPLNPKFTNGSNEVFYLLFVLNLFKFDL